MANEVVYAKVLSKDRAHFTSRPSNTVSTDDPVTYAEVNVRLKSDRSDDTPKTTHTVTCLKNSPWCYVVATLYFTAIILLITVILLAVKCHQKA